jgi:ubiquinone/menaquinone biosynthesis C-methylase UbiE
MSVIKATAYSKSTAQAYDRTRFSTPGGLAVHRAELAILLSALHHTCAGGPVLEVGCGTGRLLLDARAAGYRVDGADASPDMLEQLRSKAQDRYPDLELKLAEGAKLPFPDSTFDFVYSIRVLNQTESPEYALSIVAEMLRVAKPRAHVLVEFVNSYRPRWGGNRRSTVRLAPKQVAHAGKAHGAEVVRFRGAFFLSMQAYAAAPKPLLPIVRGVDRFCSWLMPRLCSRCYVLLRRGDVA